MAKQAKTKIVTAAFQLFLKHGYNGVSLSDIISVTQLSKGAIYHHFDSKYDIYVAAIEEYFFKMLQTEFPEDEHLTIHLRLRKRYESFVNIIDFVEHIGDSGIEYPIRAYFIFQLESERDKYILKRVRKAMNSYRLEFIKMVKSAFTNNEIHTDLSPETIAKQIMSMIEGIVIHHSSTRRNCKKILMKQYDEVIASYLSHLTTSNLSIDQV